MKDINTQELLKACETLRRRCITIADTQHGSAWLFDKMMRLFEGSDATVAVTIPVFIGEPIMDDGFATIGRDGSLVMSRYHNEW